MMSVHQMGIIGYGDMGTWHYENIRDRLQCVAVKGVYDLKPEKTERAKAAGLTVYETADALLADQDIDLVLVTTPNNFHKDYAIRALRAGKNVVSEKPVCLSSAELEEILSEADAAKRVFTVHQNRRWDIDFAIVKSVLDERTLGKPYFLDSRLYGSKGLPGDWRSNPEAGGGMLYDWSVHLIDQILCLAGSKPVRVYCQMLSVKFPDVDDCNRILIDFENGLHAQIVVDSWCYVGEPRWHVSGDDGTLIVNDWFGTNGKMIQANIKEIDWEHGVIFTKSGRTRTMAPRPKEHLKELPLPVPEEPRWEEFYENVAAAIEGKAELIVSHSQIRSCMRVLDACFISGRENRAVTL